MMNADRVKYCITPGLMEQDRQVTRRALDGPVLRRKSRVWACRKRKQSLAINLSLSLSLCFNGYILGGPWLVRTRLSPFLVLLEIRVMEVVVTTGAIKHAKLRSKCHHQQTNTQFFTGHTPFLSSN